MDPFFHDDDDIDSPMPGSAFRPAAMASHESSMNLARSAQPIAGKSQTSLGAPQGWTFDEDDLPAPSVEPFKGSGNFNGLPQHAEKQKPKKVKEPFRWPWQKRVQLEGERKIALNDHPTNTAQAFCTNYVSTSKYNAATFVPKFLLGASRALQLPGLRSDVAQSNLANTPMSSSCSPVRRLANARELTHAAQPLSSRYLACRLRTGTRLSPPSLSCCWPLPSRKRRRTS